MAMMRSRASVGNTAPFRLLYSVREPEAVFYRDELRALSDNRHSVSIVYAYTRAVPKDWARSPGRIDAALIADATWPATLFPGFYICGPTSFVESVTELLIASGYHSDKIRTERFGPTGDLK